MVRKRSRTSRKYYDDENDSDSDFALEDPVPNEPAPKKYSLRQRKRRLFTEFEFNDDGDEIEPTKAPSDDDDFEVERELELNKTPDPDCTGNETYLNDYEPENEDLPKDADGLIDFEDMIRADIVVNKNRIDYDNIIQKTEIKIQPVEDIIQPVTKSKRGRKPKAMPVEEIDSSLLEPETEMREAEFEDKDDADYNPADEDSDNEESIDCTKLLHAELKESSNEIPTIVPINDIISTINRNNIINTQDTQLESDKILQNTFTAHDSLLKNNEDSLLILSHETTVTDGKTSLAASRNDVETTSEKASRLTDTVVVDIDDDDVVLVEDEKKCEVIVLDD